jgi:hypothetical protein
MPPFKKPWEKYKLTRHNQAEFDDVSHVTHLDTGLKILKDKKILPSLVRDESILNTDRIEVNWLSPNYWVDGFRYGNVRFKFEFDQLAKDKYIFWVEEMKKYSPIAVRFLISKTGYDDNRLRYYDPRTDQGPLQYIHGKWIRHNDITLELMVDEPLKLRNCKGVDFVKHHHSLCCISDSCAQAGMSTFQASAQFLAMLILQTPPVNLTRILRKTDNGVEPGELCQGISHILAMANKPNYTGKINGLDIDAKLNLLLAFFVHIVNNENTAFKMAISIFQSADEFEKLFFRLLEKRLGITDLSCVG